MQTQPSTSLSYNFQYINADRIIEDAFARLGLSPSFIDATKYSQAKDSINFLFTSWVTKNFVNLFTIDQQVIPMVQGQRTYPLPVNTSKILEAAMVNIERIDPTDIATFKDSSNSANVIQVFQNYPNTSPVTQTFADGWFQVAFDDAQTIDYIGLASNTKKTYTVVVEALIRPENNDINNLPTDPNWQIIYQGTTDDYLSGIERFFVLNQISAKYYRVRETGGAILDVLSISLWNKLQVNPMVAQGRDYYTKLTDYTTSSSPTNYYVQRGRSPNLYVYPLPDSSGQLFLYNRVKAIQDINDYLNTFDMDYKFLDALSAGLAARLAQFYAPEKIEIMTNIADSLFIKASNDDTENVPLSLPIR